MAYILHSNNIATGYKVLIYMVAHCEFYDGTVYDIVLHCCWWKYVIIIVPHLVWSAAFVILTSCFEGSSLSLLPCM